MNIKNIRKFKVLQINDSFEGGGAELVFRKTCDLLKGLGMPVTTYYGSQQTIPEFSDLFSYFFSIKHIINIWFKIKNFQPDIVHIHNYYHKLSPSIIWFLKLIKKSNNFKIVVTLHDYHLLCANNAYLQWNGDSPHICEKCNDKRYHQILFNKCDRRNRIIDFFKYLQHTLAYNVFKLEKSVDLFISPSNFLKNKHGNILNNDKLRTVYNPAFDIKSNVKKVEQIAQNISENFQSIFIGRVTPEKGLHVFFENDYTPEKFGKMVIIGDGETYYKSQLIELLERKKIDQNIKFLGQIDHIKTMAYLKKSEIMIFSSVWYENCPLTILEAKYFGKEIFHNNLGAITEIISAVENNPQILDEQHYIQNVVESYESLFDGSSYSITDQ